MSSQNNLVYLDFAEKRGKLCCCGGKRVQRAENALSAFDPLQEDCLGQVDGPSEPCSCNKASIYVAW